jgi:hypothetical protein
VQKLKKLVEKIYNILTSFLGDAKGGYRGDKDTQYQFNCPCCAEHNGGVDDNKFNLEINVSIGKMKCWKCSDTDGTQGNITKLIKEYGNNSLLTEYLEEIKNLKENQLYNINLLTINELPKIDVKLPVSYRFIKDINTAPYQVKDYLIKRKIDQKTIDKYNVGYTTWDNNEEKRYRGRIIFPSFDYYNKLNYWVGRDYSNNEKRLKYMNSDVDKTSIMFWENKINWDADIYLVEGVFDAITINNAIPMLGKSLKKENYLFKTLYKKTNANIVIILDSDTDITETKRIYKQLNIGRLKNRIYYVIPKLEKDLGDIYQKHDKKGIINTLNNINNFKEIELIW